MKRLYAFRGAIDVASDDEQLIVEAVKELYDTFLSRNEVTTDDMVSINFTVTSDLRTLNPATALRRSFTHLQVPLFCMAEAEIDHMMERTIRVMIYFYAKEGYKVKHAYLGTSGQLRPDLNSLS
ncbi:MAG: chorismate mutase [Sphaerochaetaceae bacterium]|jgi:chorismate mutase